MIDHQRHAGLWASKLKGTLRRLEYEQRPIHVFSANMHSMRNLLYGPGALDDAGMKIPEDLYDMIRAVRDRDQEVEEYARRHGFTYLADSSGSTIDVNIIDMAQLHGCPLHPALPITSENLLVSRPIILVIDYAFGTQAFDIMDELLKPEEHLGSESFLNIASISIMGKAGVLPGKKGDIMLATAHVMEGTADNYIVANDLCAEDFDAGVTVFSGPMVTVLGTSLQNRDVLQRFHSSSWRAIGLEMEGGHYQRAISGAIIQGHIPPAMRTRYAYYASDNPLISGQTLASGPMGVEGIAPTYMISKVILGKIGAHQEG